MQDLTSSSRHSPACSQHVKMVGTKMSIAENTEGMPRDDESVYLRQTNQGAGTRPAKYHFKLMEIQGGRQER